MDQLHTQKKNTPKQRKKKNLYLLVYKKWKINVNY